MKIIENKLFEKGIYYTIVLNLIAMVIESEPNLDDSTIGFLKWFELFSIVIFTLEYFLRTVYSYKHKKSYNSKEWFVIWLFMFIRVNCS